MQMSPLPSTASSGNRYLFIVTFLYRQRYDGRGTVIYMFTHYNPVELVFGPGTVDRIGSLVREHGGTALVVTGRSSMKKTGVLDQVLASLDEAGLEASVFDEVEPNPSFPTVDAGAEQAKECDLVIGLGGGSPMDAAKAIAIAAANNRPIADFYDGEEPLRTMPIFAVASTAGTGSEVDRYFVLTNPDSKEKHGWGHRSTYPAGAIVDPAVMQTMPPRLTASTGLDAFFHALETSISLNATPITDIYATAALRRIIDALPAAYRDGGDMAARESMALASALAGMAIDGGGVTMLHGLEHPVSGHLDVAHGAGLAALSISYIERVGSACPDRFRRIAALFDRESDGPVAGTVAGLRELLQAVDMDVGLSDLGVPADLVDQLTEDALKGGQAAATPCELDATDIREIYRESL